MEGMPPDNGYLPPLSRVQIKTAKTQKHLYCLVFTSLLHDVEHTLKGLSQKRKNRERRP